MRQCKLVAEIGINHNGDVHVATKLIRAAVAAGFDYVKFQKRNVELTTPPEKRDQLKSTPWGDVPYIEYKRRLEFDERDYALISTVCKDAGIQWFASPWDVDSLAFLASFDVPYVKVASAMNTDHDFLRAVKGTGLPVIMSTGMTDREQFFNAINLIGDNVQYVLACTSTYPSSPDEQNLTFVRTLARSYAARPGFSNHSPGLLFAAASVLYGAEMIEVHVTLDRAMWGSDQAASIEPEGMFKLAKYVESLERAIGDGDWHVYESEEPSMRSLRWRDYR